MIATSQTPIATLLKVMVFALSGMIMAFVVFAVMSKLAQSEKSFSEVKPGVMVTVNTVQPDEPIKKITRELPKPPEMVTPPERVPLDIEPTDGNPGLVPFGIDIDLPSTATSEIGLGGPRNNDATPMFRVEPNYPAKAARDGVEGWVSLSFSIDKTGRVFDIKVIEAKPKRYFEKAAKKALKKWKYQPKLVDGKAVERIGQSILLEFGMAQS